MALRIIPVLHAFPEPYHTLIQRWSLFSLPLNLAVSLQLSQQNTAEVMYDFKTRLEKAIYLHLCSLSWDAHS